MGVERLFYEAIKQQVEPITREDVALLGQIGVQEYPFFKFTEGGNSIVVFGYEKDGARFVVRLKEQDALGFNIGIYTKLEKWGIGVAGFFGSFPACGKKLTYIKNKKRVPVFCYEVAEWVGYDFAIQARAAVSLLERCNFNIETALGAAAYKTLQKIGFVSGQTFGLLHRRGLLYLDFTYHNLAGDATVRFFDIHGDAFKRSPSVDDCVLVCYSFFKYADWYPENEEHRKWLFVALKNEFVRGLDSAEADGTIAKKIERDSHLWLKEILKK